jgi:hypothetical protein
MANTMETSSGLTASSLASTDSERQPQAPLTIKQILAQLDGVFPIDEAVIDGNEHSSLFVPCA